MQPESLANNLSEINTKIKIEVIEEARKWPLYLCRFYPVIEERLNEQIPLLLGINETGIYLLLNSFNNKQNKTIKIQSHFNYSDILEILIENQKLLRLITRQNINVVLTSIYAESIKLCIEQNITGKAFVNNKKII